MEFPRLDTQSFSIDDPVETVVSGMITALSRWHDDLSELGSEVLGKGVIEAYEW